MYFFGLVESEYSLYIFRFFVQTFTTEGKYFGVMLVWILIPMLKNKGEINFNIM